MQIIKLPIIIFVYLISFFSLSCLGQEKLVIYNWADFISPELIAKFEKETNIKITYDVFDDYNSLEAKITVKNSGYDLVFPSATPFFGTYAKLGIFEKLDKSQLKNYNNIDPLILNKLNKHDPLINEYSVPYLWVTTGIGYNSGIVTKYKIDPESLGLELIFNSAILKKLTDCGIEMLDSPTDIIPLALLYLGRDPNSFKYEDLKAAESLIKKIRPFIRNFNNSQYIDNLTSGSACLVVGYSGDIIQAQQRAESAGIKHKLFYALPKQGSDITIEVMAILKDAKNKTNAYKFINFLLEPVNIAAIAAHTNFASPNAASIKLLDIKNTTNENIYPKKEMFDKLYLQKYATSDYIKTRNRSWIKILTHEPN